MVYGTTSSFAPYLRDDANQQAEARELNVLGAYSMIAFGTAAPMAMAWFVSRAGGESLASQIARWLRSRIDGGRGRQHQALCAEATIPPFTRLDGEALNEVMAEVRRFKWLEAERAGRDIWRERDPVNPEAPAIEEWVKRHYCKWARPRAARLRAVA